MGIRSKLVLILLSHFLTTISGDSTIDWSHKLDLEEAHGVKFRWKNTSPDRDGQRWITMEVSAKARGYVGVGFSPHGGMAGADMAIAWRDSDGMAHIKDLYGVDNGRPFEDDQQDYELLHFETHHHWTTIQIKRRWDTCDPQDFIIANDTMRLIWAYSDKTPRVVSGTFLPDYHSPQNRGAKSVIIAEGGIFGPFPDDAWHKYPDVKTFDMTMNNVPITLKDTYYFCKIFKFTDLSKKHHMIGWRPIIQDGNMDIVHHILVFECSVPQEYVPQFDHFHESHQGGACYTPNMPLEWGKCVGFSLVWVVGSEGDMLPKHVGSPLGEEHGGSTYFMLEMHYENAAHRITTDSSGIRMFYTDKLRENDGGTMLLGYRHSPFLLVPPNQEIFKVSGVCGTECTSKVIPPSGIHLTNSMVHLHLTGRKIRLRHFRDGVELPMIAEDNHYDFNYQQSRIFKDELTVLPGDELLTECEYSTSNVDRYVIGGLATHQEMCQVFFFYYPRVPLAQCTSQYEFHDFFKGLGVDEIEGKVLKALHMPYEPHLLPLDKQEDDIGDDAKEMEAIEAGISYRSVFTLMNITKPDNLRGKSVDEYLREQKWVGDKGKILEKVWQNGKQYQFCSKPGLKRVILDNHVINYPKIKSTLYRGPSDICLKEQLRNRLRITNSVAQPVSNILVIFISVILFWKI